MINQLIDLLEQSHQEMNSLVEKINRNNKQIEQVNNTLSDPNNLLSLDFDVIKHVLSKDEKLYSNIIILREIIEGNVKFNLDFDIEQNQITSLNNALSILKEKLEEENDSLHQQIVDYTNLEELKIKLDNKNPKFITKEDLSILIPFLNQKKWSEEEIINMLTDIIILNKDKNVKEEQSTLNETNLDEREVRELFETYSIDFDQMEGKEILLKYGSLSNMREILDCIEKILPQINTKLESFSYILVFSRKEIVENLLRFKKEYNLTDSYESLFINASDFFEQSIVSKRVSNVRKKYQSRSPRKKYVRNGSNNYIGNYADFEENRKYLEKMQFDVSTVYRRCHSILTVPNEALVRDFKILKLYNLEPKDTDSLSMLGKHVILPLLIDRFLELGLAGYLQKYPSCLANYTNKLFYNIYYKNKRNEVYLNSHGQIINSGELRTKLIEPANEEDRIIENLEERLTEDGVSYDVCEKLSSEIDYNHIERCLADSRMVELEAYKVNSLIYKFGNIIVSRNKVLKIMSDLLDSGIVNFDEALFFAITYNSLLDENDYNEIKDFVHTFTNQRRKKWSS